LGEDTSETNGSEETNSLGEDMNETNGSEAETNGSGEDMSETNSSEETNGLGEDMNKTNGSKAETNGSGEDMSETNGSEETNGLGEDMNETNGSEAETNGCGEDMSEMNGSEERSFEIPGAIKLIIEDKFLSPEEVLALMHTHRPSGKNIPQGIKENVVFLLENETISLVRKTKNKQVTSTTAELSLEMDPPRPIITF
jgi:hypothetical protein